MFINVSISVIFANSFIWVKFPFNGISSFHFTVGINSKSWNNCILSAYTNKACVIVSNYRCADDAEEDPVHMYYINDGVYGSFNNYQLHHIPLVASVLDVSASVCFRRSLYFYPRDAMLAWVLAVIVYPSVRLSVRLSQAGTVPKRLNIGSRKRRHVIAQDSFWRQQSLVGHPHSPWNLHWKWPTPFWTQRFRPISAHSTSTVRDGEKRSISTNRKWMTRFPTSHSWTVYVTPKSLKGWHKTRFCCFCQ